MLEQEYIRELLDRVMSTVPLCPRTDLLQEDGIPTLSASFLNLVSSYSGATNITLQRS